MFYEIRNLLINLAEIQYIELITNKKTNTYIIAVHFIYKMELLYFVSYSELIDEYNMLKQKLQEFFG